MQLKKVRKVALTGAAVSAVMALTAVLGAVQKWS